MYAMYTTMITDRTHHGGDSTDMRGKLCLSEIDCPEDMYCFQSKGSIIGSDYILLLVAGNPLGTSLLCRA